MGSEREGTKEGMRMVLEGREEEEEGEDVGEREEKKEEEGVEYVK